jgi:hypothetical protein
MWPSCGLKLASPAVIDVKKEIGMYMGTMLSKSDSSCRENHTNIPAVIDGKKEIRIL